MPVPSPVTLDMATGLTPSPAVLGTNIGGLGKSEGVTSREDPFVGAIRLKPSLESPVRPTIGALSGLAGVAKRRLAVKDAAPACELRTLGSDELFALSPFNHGPASSSTVPSLEFSASKFSVPEIGF